MKIAIFGTNFTSTPPGEKEIYAPLWIALHLADGLVKKGHKVFLFGSSDSKTKAKLISGGMPAFWKNKEWSRAFGIMDKKEQLIARGRHEFTWVIKWKEVLRENYELLLASRLAQMAQKGMFDVVQFHSPLRVLHFAGVMNLPVFFTMHDPISHPFESNTVGTIAKAFNKTKNVNFISISKVQRKPFPGIRWAGNVYNGTDLNRFGFSAGKGDYLAFAGRVLPQKGVGIAVKVAKKTGKKLKIVGTLRAEHNDFWYKKVKPYLSRRITYEGIILNKDMPEFYQNAEALLMPILWPEPFGLVMTEAMACGAPVIGFNMGSVGEVVKNNKSGYIVNNEREMVKAVQNIDRIKREDCRAWVENNFSLENMVNNYEKLYLKALKRKN